MPTERGGNGRGGARRLLAGLRVSAQDEALLELVRPFLADAASEGELAYRLWRRGLEVILAEVVGLGAALPSEMTEDRLAGLVSQRLLLCLPLLRRTGKLEYLGLETTTQESSARISVGEAAVSVDEAVIDQGAAEVIAGLGAADFL
jgi:hypothetical protein